MTDLIEIRKHYGSHKSFEELALRWSEILNFPVTSTQVVLMLLDLKMMKIKYDTEYHEEMMGDGRYVSCLEGLLFREKK